MTAYLQQWLEQAASKPGADILVVQTLRNAIMVASVLASAATVALMGILATAHLHARSIVALAAVLLALSTASALCSMVKISRIGIDMQMSEMDSLRLAKRLLWGQRWVIVSALSLSMALVVAAAAVLA